MTEFRPGMLVRTTSVSGSPYLERRTPGALHRLLRLDMDGDWVAQPVHDAAVCSRDEDPEAAPQDDEPDGAVLLWLGGDRNRELGFAPGQHNGSARTPRLPDEHQPFRRAITRAQYVQGAYADYAEVVVVHGTESLPAGTPVKIDTVDTDGTTLVRTTVGSGRTWIETARLARPLLAPVTPAPARTPASHRGDCVVRVGSVVVCTGHGHAELQCGQYYRVCDRAQRSMILHAVEAGDDNLRAGPYFTVHYQVGEQLPLALAAVPCNGPLEGALVRVHAVTGGIDHYHVGDVGRVTHTYSGSLSVDFSGQGNPLVNGDGRSEVWRSEVSLVAYAAQPAPVTAEPAEEVPAVIYEVGQVVIRPGGALCTLTEELDTGWRADSATGESLVLQRGYGEYGMGVAAASFFPSLPESVYGMPASQLAGLRVLVVRERDTGEALEPGTQLILTGGSERIGGRTRVGAHIADRTGGMGYVVQPRRLAVLGMPPVIARATMQDRVRTAPPTAREEMVVVNQAHFSKPVLDWLRGLCDKPGTGAMHYGDDDMIVTGRVIGQDNAPEGAVTQLAAGLDSRSFLHIQRSAALSQLPVRSTLVA